MATSRTPRRKQGGSARRPAARSARPARAGAARARRPARAKTTPKRPSRRPSRRRTTAGPMEPVWLASYPPGVPQSSEYPDVPLTALLDESVRQFPNNAALDFQGSRFTYRELGELVDKMAGVLKSLGVDKGTRVGTILPNVPQNVITYYAAHRLGATVVENNPMYTDRELTHQLNDAEVEVLVVLDLFYANVRKIREDLPKLREVIVTNVFDGMKGIKALLGPRTKKGKAHMAPVDGSEPVRLWKDLMKSSKGGVRQTEIDPGTDLALLLYTGGTTGLSKGVMLTHRNMVSNAWQGRLWFSDLQPGKEVVMCALPLFHSYGQTVCMNIGLLLGATLVLVPNPRDIEGLLKEIDRTKPTLFPGVPTLYVGLMAHPKFKEYDLKSIRACLSGAAPLPLEVQEQWEKLVGGRLVEGYGLSETSPITHANPIYGKRKIGTIGLPVPDTQCKLVDVDDPDVAVEPPGPGELCLKGPQVMQGYWNRPEETAEVLRDGWLHTGDIAEIDEEGFFKIVDRKKDMIIVGGFNVYPRDIEEVLYQHPKVLEACVAGIRHPKSGETVKAYIVPKPGEQPGEDLRADIEAFVRERLTGYKVPKQWEFRSELPKTMVGKVLRRALVEEENRRLAERKK